MRVRNIGFQRRLEGPWVIVEIPHDEDPLYPAKRRYYARSPRQGGTSHESVEHLEQAFRFTDLKEAKRAANVYMHRNLATWAEPVPFAIAWAIAHASTAKWEARPVPKVRSG